MYLTSPAPPRSLVWSLLLPSSPTSEARGWDGGSHSSTAWEKLGLLSQPGAHSATPSACRPFVCRQDAKLCVFYVNRGVCEETGETRECEPEINQRSWRQAGWGRNLMDGRHEWS